MPDPLIPAEADHAARAGRFRQTVRLFLDGIADRHTDKYGRYAHIFQGPLTVWVTDSDEREADALRAVYHDGQFVGTIDLDNGEVVAEGDARPLGRRNA
jgi:hypothetical protein